MAVYKEKEKKTDGDKAFPQVLLPLTRFTCEYKEGR